jgi:hypothetical protein
MPTINFKFLDCHALTFFKTSMRPLFMQWRYNVVWVRYKALIIFNPCRGPLPQRHRLSLHFRASTAASAASKCLLVLYLSFINVNFMSLPHSRGRSSESALLLALPAPPQLIRVMQINRNADVVLGKRSIWQGAVMILLGLGLARLILNHDISRLLRFLVGMSSIFF